MCIAPDATTPATPPSAARRGRPGDLVPTYAELRPGRQPPDPRRPFPHQVEAREAIDAALEESRESGRLEGLLVMPTGSGKTFTVAGWLAGRVLAGGGRVLWLAHGDALLAQAADAFHRAAGAAAGRRRLAVRMVSGQHDPVRAIDPADDVVVASVPAAALDPAALDPILGDPRTFVVVDEAHHGPAASYRRLLDRLPPRRRLLGLTATPTRTRPDERPAPAALFGGRVLYRADAARLVEQGVLARPIPVRVRTGAVLPAPPPLTDADGDFDPAWLGHVGRIERRNAAVVAHYLAYRERYGRTLIFAANIEHAVLLADRLRRAGVAADHVADGRGGGRRNREVLGRFRDPAGGLEVLVSVRMLAEGVDLPAVRTVILARPTASEILLRQMLGRALRGPLVGGTAEAYLVVLVDDGPWPLSGLDPLELAPDLAGPLPPPASRPGRRPGRGPAAAPPPEALLAAGRRLRESAPAPATEATEWRPARWYVTEGEPDGRPGLVVAYGPRVAGYEAAPAALEAMPAAELAALEPATLAGRCFAGLDGPPPAPCDLDRLAAHVRSHGRRPPSYGVEEHRACRPEVVARRIVAEDPGERARSEVVAVRHAGLAPAIDPELRAYRAAVDEALRALQHPGGPAAAPPKPVFEHRRRGRARRAVAP